MSAPGERSASRVGLLGIVGRVAGGLMVIMMLGIFGFIARTEIAHDEGRCPFRQGEVRDVGGGVRVREELRRCQPDVEERRWVILRPGAAPREFARRRLDAALFAPGAYRWELDLDDQEQLILTVHNQGTRSIEVLEAQLLEQ